MVGSKDTDAELAEAMPHVTSTNRYLGPIGQGGPVECDDCSKKPGSPTLCRACLHNRDAYNELKKAGDELLKRIELALGLLALDHHDEAVAVLEDAG